MSLSIPKFERYFLHEPCERIMLTKQKFSVIRGDLDWTSTPILSSFRFSLLVCIAADESATIVGAYFGRKAAYVPSSHFKGKSKECPST